MPQTWINFQELREKLSFADVLRHYKVEGSVKGDQHHGFCPLPKHQGKRNSPSFSANLKKGVFHCFGCQARGNILEFACLMEGVNPSDRHGFRRVALSLSDALGIGVTKEPEPAPPKPAPKAEAVPASSNLPLDFTLKGLDPDHPYLSSRGFSKHTVRAFGLGFCSRGYLKDRIAIPLHNESGELVGYAGRLIDDGLISKDSPKYKFPGKREHEGQSFDFRKLELLYNAHQIRGPVDDLIIVEGFPAVWWLYQHGLTNVVALMGSVLSRKHEVTISKLVSSGGTVWLMPDGNDAGMRCAETALPALARNHRVRWAKLTDHRQPTDLMKSELDTHFAVSIPIRDEMSLKARLGKDEIAVEEGMTELARTFPALRNLFDTSLTWDPESLDDHAFTLSKGERCALQFILHVWNQHTRWNCGRFNVFEAMDLWDHKHRAAFLSWASNPWHL
jgi:DNA primase